MTRMHINGSVDGEVRLFHLDLPPEAVERFTTQAGTGEFPLQYALGARKLRPSRIDVVSIRDLGEMSLSAYLAEAYQVGGEELRQMKPRIDALKGHVVILPSAAFDQTSQDLTISTPLRWIGTLKEAKGAGARAGKLRSAAARGSMDHPDSGAPAPRSRALTFALLGLGVLLVLALAAIFGTS
ncbi:aspartate carbamoyltransferase catalytic subunit [Alloyangia pacifica]|uniref:aspartate carbamoyltransferase catalytic subunit n=1 Tax=Alloyangia pacifica TaxID=311180 RepID=UPI001CFE557F|nr:aspartate carbamoyltransferase catalytic subunit [Alloyangia pacifica]